jgi:flagellar hook-associated protein 2
MGETMTGLVGVNDLADIGIAAPKATGTSSQDAKDGKLTLDSAKLSEALTADSRKVRELFSAFSTGLDTFVKTQAGTTGVLDARAKSGDNEIKRIGEQVTRAEERITAKEKRLKAQFAAMESALAQSQTQGAWLDGQISAMQNNRR